MKLIAESGSSKTEWRLILENEHKTFVTKGINPFFADEPFIFSELSCSDLDGYKDQITQLIFYGSGCSSEDRNQYLTTIFKRYFTNANSITVDHDMMAACIALFGRGDGIACIIGTGSNSCVYQKGIITHNVPALGYILGDEASGSFIGKEIMKHYIYKTLPSPIYTYIHDTYRIDKEDIFDGVYSKPLPNRFLASFSTIASEFRSDSFIQEILLRGFDEFVRYHILCYKDFLHLPIAAVGSIASVFQEEFQYVLKKYDLKLDKVDMKPIDALVHYHEINIE